jgi:hypothetical protein
MRYYSIPVYSGDLQTVRSTGAMMHLKLINQSLSILSTGARRMATFDSIPAFHETTLSLSIINND